MTKFHRDNFKHLESEKMIRFKDEDVGGSTLTIACYMIASPELWEIPMARECRGIVLDADGNCVSLSMHKFFNVGETQETLEENLPWDQHYNCAEKRDGSMITPVLISTGIDKTVFFKTKKSFYSDVAVTAQKNVTQEVITLSKFCLEKHLTPTFEFTSPENEVVIDYGNEPKFVLLTIRDMVSGDYLSPTKMEYIADRFGVDHIKNYGCIPFDQLKREMGTSDDMEGYVIEFSNGVRAKKKTDWYLRMHRCKTEFRERDAAEMFINETIDDIKSAISAAGLSLDPIVAIEIRVSHEIADLMERTNALEQNIRQELSRKDAAMKYRNDQVFGLAMRLYDGKEPDYKKFWIQNYLQNYSLKTIYSNFKSGDVDG